MTNKQTAHEIEEAIQEIGRNEFLEMENQRLIQDIKHMAGRLKGYQTRERIHKDIISKQNKILQSYGYENKKQFYVNIQKGVDYKKKKGMRGKKR